MASVPAAAVTAAAHASSGSSSSTPSVTIPLAPLQYTPHAILLTGGAGFIGSNVLLHLAAQYPLYDLVCLDALDLCSSVESLAPLKHNPRFTFVHGDICNAELVREICQTHDIDTIMHFASQTHVDNSFGNSLGFTYSNVQGTHTLLECAKSLNGQIRRFVHVSTDEVYGEQQADSPASLEHSTPLNPTNPYAATKAAAEFIVRSYMASFNLPVIVTRGNNVYGPRQYPEKLIPKFTSLLARGRPCPVHGTGKNRRSFLHVADVARAFDIILHRGTTGEIYNIGAEEEFENIDVLQRLIQLFRKEYPQCLNADLPDQHYITYVRDRAFNDFRYHIDSGALHRLGWRLQESDLNVGLQSTVAWYMANPHHWSHVESALAAHPYLMPNLKNTHATPTIIAQQAAAALGQPGTGAKGAVAPVIVPAAAEAGGAVTAGVSAITGDVAGLTLQGSPVGGDTPMSSLSPLHSRSILQQQQPLKWIVYGHKSVMGAALVASLHATRTSDSVLLGSAAPHDESAVEQELLSLRPERVILAAAESAGQSEDALRDALYAPACVMQCARRHRMHFTYVDAESGSASSSSSSSSYSAASLFRLVASEHSLNVHIKKSGKDDATAPATAKSIIAAAVDKEVGARNIE